MKGKKRWSTPLAKDPPSASPRETAINDDRRTALAYDDLRDWIKTLEKNGELKRVTAEVSPELEITEITDRVTKQGGPGGSAGGPALLFENVTGHAGHKVLMNQFGSERRMAMALEVERVDQ